MCVRIRAIACAGVRALPRMGIHAMAPAGIRALVHVGTRNFAISDARTSLARPRISIRGIACPLVGPWVGLLLASGRVVDHLGLDVLLPLPQARFQRYSLRVQVLLRHGDGETSQQNRKKLKARKNKKQKTKNKNEENKNKRQNRR